MEDNSTESRAAGPELDAALARAIRQLIVIAEAIEAGTAGTAEASAA